MLPLNQKHLKEAGKDLVKEYGKQKEYTRRG